MIEVTKLNDEKVTVNADLIEMIEEVPETVITFTNGKKIFVKESRQKVKNLVILYRMSFYRRSIGCLWYCSERGFRCNVGVFGFSVRTYYIWRCVHGYDGNAVLHPDVYPETQINQFDFQGTYDQ